MGRPFAHAQDMPLSTVLIDGEDWQLVAEGYQFTDATCADAGGNFYFTDAAKGTTINKIGPDGKVVAIMENTPKISGLKFAPNGRLYACTQGPKKQIVAFELPSGNMTVIADDVQPNDLVVTFKGGVYFTETGKRQVAYIDPNGKLRPANGDGMTTDTAGRYYVTSALGVQIFDPTGRICGVLSKPQNKGLVSVALAGPNLDYLYVACSDKIFRRKTKAKGVLFFQKPASLAPVTK